MATTAAPSFERRRPGCGRVHYIRRTVLAPPSRKNMGLTGVRRRAKGRWASEIRVPRTNAKSAGRIWLGTFQHIEQAALAHDAALFCVYGESPPAPRYFNYPEVPRPNIPEDIRLNLTGDNIKTIAGNHAFKFYDYVSRPHPPALLPGAGGGPDLQAMPDLVDTAVPAATDATGAAATATDDGNGNGRYASMDELLAAADFMFAMQLDDRIAFMEFANMGYWSW